MRIKVQRGAFTAGDAGVFVVKVTSRRTTLYGFAKAYGDMQKKAIDTPMSGRDDIKGGQSTAPCKDAPMLLSRKEEDYILLMGRAYEEGVHAVRQKDVMRELNITADEYSDIRRVLDGLGESGMTSKHTEGGVTYTDVYPSRRSLELAREIRKRRAEEAHPDVVARFSSWWRRSPWLAWPVIVFIVLSAAYGIVELVLRVIAALCRE
ncbi:MAG TPA: hypothetical protein VMZ92_05100 [Planctomycetota bacterium]|nr:hypothetical protein [Planctomycetota bacterium]